MKIVIIGAGEQGYVPTWNLVKHPAMHEVVGADFDEQKATEVAARVGAGEARAVRVATCDIEGVAALAENAELLINAVVPE
jgi:saccharopine dehydrogenase-like NADP-dependent oxidoreductase